MYTHIHVHTYMYTHTCTHIYMYTPHVHTHTFTHTYMHTHIHAIHILVHTTCTHTHTCILIAWKTSAISTCHRERVQASACLHESEGEECCILYTCISLFLTKKIIIKKFDLKNKIVYCTTEYTYMINSLTDMAGTLCYVT